jgi:hypothetical protein
VTEEIKQGENWSAIELDAIIADYFAMLGDELAQRPYVKAHHRVVLMQMTDRSAASVEFKHRNISAVLRELGLPWIWGYKPAPNYQEALFEAVDRYLSGNRNIVEHQPAAPPLTVLLTDVFTEMPATATRPRRPALERLVRKFDPVERDFRNRELGRVCDGTTSLALETSSRLTFCHCCGRCGLPRRSFPYVASTLSSWPTAVIWPVQIGR